MRIVSIGLYKKKDWMRIVNKYLSTRSKQTKKLYSILHLPFKGWNADVGLQITRSVCFVFQC